MGGRCLEVLAQWANTPELVESTKCYIGRAVGCQAQSASFHPSEIAVTVASPET